ncbi:MAG: DUF1295 domain-containing protein [Candidatus Cloacimonadaceae bacterium]|nr:DUF1295 domain-containing protein [Candidatus Cloacimonadaceae bacterium]
MIGLDCVLFVVGAVFAYFNLLFLWAMLLKKNDIVDVAWGIGFILVALLYLLLVPQYHWRRLLVTALVTLWGLRLAVYIFIRNRGKQEDFRYAQWKRDWGKNWVIRSYFQVFILQGFFLLTIAYPLFLHRVQRVDAFNLFDLIGLGLWLLGFCFEAVGDAQMRRFKLDPANKGRIMNRGLWRYTRHPNYFGESMMWWGIFALTLNAANGIAAIASPIIITFLLVRVSGVPMLEK